MITLIFLDRLYSTVVDIGMVLELYHLDSESICFCGAGGIQAFPHIYMCVCVHIYTHTHTHVLLLNKFSNDYCA